MLLYFLPRLCVCLNFVFGYSLYSLYRVLLYESGKFAFKYFVFIGTERQNKTGYTYGVVASICFFTIR